MAVLGGVAVSHEGGTPAGFRVSGFGVWQVDGGEKPSGRTRAMCLCAQRERGFLSHAGHTRAVWVCVLRGSAESSLILMLREVGELYIVYRQVVCVL